MIHHECCENFEGFCDGFHLGFHLLFVVFICGLHEDEILFRLVLHLVAIFGILNFDV